MPEEETDSRQYKVVVNEEEQYSIWFADRESPAGWREAGKQGLKQECLSYIEEVWTDIRPLSLRRRMEAAERKRTAEEEGEASAS
jgi:MbtH protein